MKENTLTIDQVADLLRVHRPHVYRWIRQGLLKADKSGEKTRITKDDLQDFLDNTPDGRAFELTWDRLQYTKGGTQGPFTPGEVETGDAQEKGRSGQ